MARKHLSSTLGTCIRRLLPLSLLLSLVLSAAPSRAVHADWWPSQLDQSFASPTNGSAAFDQCCHYVAQTFTAGVTGGLTSIRVEINSWVSASLRFAIHGVTNGVPDARILGESTIWETTDEPVITAYLDREIQLYPPVHVVAGQQYAIVVNYVDTTPNGDGSGSWWGATGDEYKGGSVFLTNDETFATWETWPGFPDLDLHFQTYVVPNMPLADLKITRVSGPKKAHACQVFRETYRVTNLGPDPANHLQVSIGGTDQFDFVSVDGVPGNYSDYFTLAPGQSRTIVAYFKVVAFGVGESRDASIGASIFWDYIPYTGIDPNPENNSIGTPVWLVGKPSTKGCPVGQ